MGAYDPAVFAAIDSLDLRARWVVEGYMAGMHRSPFKGASVEFAQHRGYVPGDDPRHLDWKVWGRSERWVIKQYEAETNLVTQVLVDTSASMDYRGGRAWGGLSKLDYAKVCAAALVHLVLEQSDAAACAVFAERVEDWSEVSGKRGHLRRVCGLLDAATPRPRGDVARVLHDVAGRLKRRGIVVVVSDCLADLRLLARGLAHLRAAGQDVVVVQVLDRDELEFPFDGMVRFEGLEGGDPLLCHPRSLRHDYLAELHRHQAGLDAACRGARIDLVVASTATPPDHAITAWLHRREAGR